MANKEQDYKPQAKPADEATKPCQEFIRLYPTRFALTDKAFENIKTKGEIPLLPKNSSGDENYDVRRLRDGYVYILAVNAEVKGCFEISAEAADGQAWYIYRYRSKDVDFNQGNQAYGINYSFSLFNDYETGYTNTVTLPTPYIELNKAIESAYMMFADVGLPMSLLRKIETDPLVRNHWMRNVQLKNPQDYSINMSTLQQTVKDFSPQTKMMTDQTLTSNAYRFTPIGKPTGWEEIKNQLMHSQNGVIVALEDPVGTTRDLSGYHLYLTAERDKVLAKYEYAISTARILDAHALHKYKEAVKSARDSLEMANAELSDQGLRTIEPAPIKFSQLYQKVFSDYINSEHLKANGDADVLNVLKSELQLEDELPGVNAINKMAYIPTRFGTFFKNVANAHSAFIATHSNKLSALYDLYDGNP